MIPENPQRKKRVVIVGGGPAGLACLRVYVESGYDWDILLYEAREEIGGVWYKGPDALSTSPGLPPPSNPIYDSLTTNIPHPVMGFNNFLFPPSTPLYPPASSVQQYILNYADHFGLRKFIRLKSRVEDARWIGHEWTYRLSGEDARRACDHIMIANGHFSKPHLPPIPGMDAWASTGGRSSMHTMYYRNPAPYVGRRVLVVGAGPSGRDISAEISSVAVETFHCVRGYVRDETSNPKKRPEIAYFDPEGDGIVRYVDGSVDRGIERLVLGTGYEFSYPMLPEIQKADTIPSSTLPTHLQQGIFNLYPLAKHMFPIQSFFPPTSLVFIAIPSQVIPMQIAEDQAVAAFHAFTHPEALDVEAEKAKILTRTESIVKRCGDDKLVLSRAWHRLPGEQGYNLRRELLAFAGWTKWGVEQWMIDAYHQKETLREQWREVLLTGEAEEYVRGAATKEDWQRVIARLLRRAEGREVKRDRPLRCTSDPPLARL